MKPFPKMLHACHQILPFVCSLGLTVYGACMRRTRLYTDRPSVGDLVRITSYVVWVSGTVSCDFETDQLDACWYSIICHRTCQYRDNIVSSSAAKHHHPHPYSPLHHLYTMSNQAPAQAVNGEVQAEGQYHEPLSSELRPQTDATLTIRIIKSFEFRTQKSMVIKGVNLLEETIGGLMQRVRDCEYFSLDSNK